MSFNLLDQNIFRQTSIRGKQLEFNQRLKISRAIAKLLTPCRDSEQLAQKWFTLIGTKQFNSGITFAWLFCCKITPPWSCVCRIEMSLTHQVHIKCAWQSVLWPNHTLARCVFFYQYCLRGNWYISYICVIPILLCCYHTFHLGLKFEFKHSL